MTSIVNTISIFQRIMCCTWSKSSRSWEKTWSQSDRQDEAPWCEHSDTAKTYVFSVWPSAMSGRYQWWTRQSLGNNWKIWAWALPRKDHLHVKAQWTWLGENGEIMKLVLRMQSELLSMLVSGPGRNGTEPMSTNRMENGINLLKASCSTLPKADVLYFVPAALWKGELKSKGKGVKTAHFNGSDETIEFSVQCLRSSGRFL